MFNPCLVGGNKVDEENPNVASSPQALAYETVGLLYIAFDFLFGAGGTELSLLPAYSGGRVHSFGQASAREFGRSAKRTRGALVASEGHLQAYATNRQSRCERSVYPGKKLSRVRGRWGEKPPDAFLVGTQRRKTRLWRSSGDSVAGHRVSKSPQLRHGKNALGASGEIA